MGYVWAWVRNIFADLLIVGAVIAGLLLFTRIFYPDVFTLLFAAGQRGVGLAGALKLWPLIILAVVLYALPRHWRRRKK